MGTLGSFGKSRPAVEESFDWFGHEIRVHPDLSDIAIIDIVGAMHDDTKAIETIARLGETLVHPDDLDEFMRVARANRQTMDDIAELAMELIGALAERPTELPSDSSDGQQTTARTSTGDSSSRAIEALEGRPDLQLMVMRRKAV